MIEERYMICPSCDKEQRVQIDQDAYTGVAAAKCQECGLVEEPDAYGLSGAEQDAIREEIAELSGIQGYLQGVYVALDTYSDSNTLSPSTVVDLRALQRRTSEALEEVEKRHKRQMRLFQQITDNDE